MIRYEHVMNMKELARWIEALGGMLSMLEDGKAAVQPLAFQGPLPSPERELAVLMWQYLDHAASAVRMVRARLQALRDQIVREKKMLVAHPCPTCGTGERCTCFAGN